MRATAASVSWHSGPMILRTVLSAALLTLATLPASAQQSQEEIRFQPEIRACEAQPEPQRKTCIDAVRAKIRAAWLARIEEQSRRRQPP